MITTMTQTNITRLKTITARIGARKAPQNTSTRDRKQLYTIRGKPHNNIILLWLIRVSNVWLITS